VTERRSATERRALLPFLVGASLLAAGVSQAAGPTEAEVASASARITAASAFATVEVLAAPGMAGRLSGTDGYRKAVDHVVSELRKAGLRPPADLPDYRQAFTHGLAGIEAASLTFLPPRGRRTASRTRRRS
jgi:hypothetical protein